MSHWSFIAPWQQKCFMAVIVGDIVGSYAAGFSERFIAVIFIGLKERKSPAEISHVDLQEKPLLAVSFPPSPAHLCLDRQLYLKPDVVSLSLRERISGIFPLAEVSHEPVSVSLPNALFLPQ